LFGLVWKDVTKGEKLPAVFFPLRSHPLRQT
jgi:hypothetical protein